jgi:hypothetical protein
VQVGQSILSSRRSNRFAIVGSTKADRKRKNPLKDILFLKGLGNGSISFPKPTKYPLRGSEFLRFQGRNKITIAYFTE